MQWCKECHNKPGPIEGLCSACAAEVIKQYDILKTNLETALEPVRDWYGEGSFTAIEILTDVVADLQKDRAEVIGLRNLVARSQRDLSEVRGQVVKLSEWCKKRFSVVIPGLIAQENWPDTICEVVIKVIEEAW